MYVGLHVKFPFILSDFNQKLISQQNFEEYLNIKFHDNPSGRTDERTERQIDGRTDRQK